MKRRLLLILPALQQLDNYAFRLIKYSRFPPLSLLTIAGMTPEDDWDILVRDEHIESSEVEGHINLVSAVHRSPSRSCAMILCGRICQACIDCFRCTSGLALML